MAHFIQFCVPVLVNWVPTTDIFRRDQTGSWVAVHLFSGALQAEIRRSTCVGFVAALISERVLAQQQLLTSHMKEKTTVTRKSCSEKEQVENIKKRSHTPIKILNAMCFMSLKHRHNHTLFSLSNSCWDIRGVFVEGINSLTTSGPLLYFRYLFW